MVFLTILNLNKKSNMNKIEQILVLLLFLPVLHAMAEDNNNGLTPDMLLPQFANLTPEAASLGRYGAYQVSEYSGTANTLTRGPLTRGQSPCALLTQGEPCER